MVATMLAVLPAQPADAHHNECDFQNYTHGDQMTLNTYLSCRQFIVDSGYNTIMDRQGLLANEDLYTSDPAHFTRNFLWYSYQKEITIDDPSTRWTGCREYYQWPGRCDIDDIISAHYGGVAPSPGAPGILYNAYHGAASMPLSVFEFEGSWIARACGNWHDIAERPNPIPTFNGVKFRDNNRDGVRDGGEVGLKDWEIRISRTSSLVGQSTGELETILTAADGSYSFALDGHGPGTYTIEEMPQTGWTNYTPIKYTINVGFGIGDKSFTRNFGNAETIADVAKVEMQILDGPENLEVNTPTDISVRVVIENLGPADVVDVEDQLVAVLQDDCAATDPTKSFSATLERDVPVSRDFTFTITCSRPSDHVFTFEDEVSITTPGVTDPNLLNNERSETHRAPVHASTDLAANATLVCDPETDVDVEATCTVDVTVTNDGFGPIDATTATQLDLPSDCVSVPDLATTRLADLESPESRTFTESFGVTCTHRSFHEIQASVAVTADDPHVFDTNEDNNSGGDGPSIMEVFNDASMEGVDVHLTCDETLGDPTFTCTATVDYRKVGPAPLVEVVLWSKLEGPETCTFDPEMQQQEFVLDGFDVHTRTFTWNVTCELSETLHPFTVWTDINPAESEPHAEDDPHPIHDDHVVPYCLPTVNPHGKNEPSAPGNGDQGMNQDGFYIFGVLGDDETVDVRIRDDESGIVFGPYSDGTRIKWVEANGTEPSETIMGGNNGNGKGEALAVDYQIKANGDAQAFVVDERGVETSVTCLVPNDPM